MDKFTKIAKIKEALTGKKIFSRLKVVERVIDQGKQIESTETLNSEYFDPNNAGDIVVNVIRPFGQPRFFKNVNQLN